MDTNVNLAECIVKQGQWGQTLITNICSGSVQTLPWQLGDWAGALALCGVGVLLVGMIFLFLGMVIQILKGY